MKGFLLFAAGAVVGTITGAVLVKNKVMADAQQEIEEVREYYKTKKQEDKKIEKTTEEPKAIEEQKETEVEEDDEQEEYKEITKRYVNYNKPEQSAKVPVDINYMQAEDEPYIIEPEQFGDQEEEGWDVMTLTYFADKVLVDDVDEVIEDVDTVVGLENLKVFDEFPEAMSVYVRNEIWRTDFEILRDDWKWSDLREPNIVPAQEKKPHQL